MMYGKDSIKCTDVRLVNDETFYEVIIDYTRELGKQFTVIWYGCHRTQKLNIKDKEYIPLVRYASRWSEKHSDANMRIKSIIHIDKYLTRELYSNNFYGTPNHNTVILHKKANMPA